MTRAKADKIVFEAGLFYRVFPVERENCNHKIVKNTAEIIRRIMEYKGNTRGSNALPKPLLVRRYDEMYKSLQELREGVDRSQSAYREALKAVGDAELLLEYIFI